MLSCESRTCCALADLGSIKQVMPVQQWLSGKNADALSAICGFVSMGLPVRSLNLCMIQF